MGQKHQCAAGPEKMFRKYTKNEEYFLVATGLPICIISAQIATENRLSYALWLPPYYRSLRYVDIMIIRSGSKVSELKVSER
jgi:hypothetical protein